jgi:site-specific DNA recombinase
MSPSPVAIYARVSSEPRPEAPTIASQIAALRQRVAADGFTLPDSMQFLDENYTGATLVRPALERLRDLMAAGAVERLYVHSPDRLARKYAYQVLLVEEFQRLGVEIIFLNRPLGQSPEDDLLLQVQGMMAEYERAKIMERHRRGKLHAAQAGSVNVLSGAPYGYRYVTKHDGGGQARYDIVPDEARVVRQMFDWIGRERVSIGEVCRRLQQAGEVTRTGKTVWDRSAVWGMLKNPAYQGQAAFGKTRQGPLRPRLRAQRGKPLQPRSATDDYDVPPEDWISIAVPVIVPPEVFAAVQEQLEENRRHARQSSRGALYLLQGLLQCQHCGYAFYGKRLSPASRKGKPRAYAYYRCLGTDAHRFGGERICPNTQVRTDRLDLAVWQEVCALLAHPDRLAEEYRRRLQPDGTGSQQERSALEAQVSKFRQGLARLIDSYAEGLIEKTEFEPRISRLRQRIAHVEVQCQQLADEETLQHDLDLIIGRLDAFGQTLHHRLDDIEWGEQREIIRALVKRVEIGEDQVQVIFRVEPYLGETDPEKKSLQLCRGSIQPVVVECGTSWHGASSWDLLYFPRHPPWDVCRGEIRR